jgi:hypothetical protein
LIKTGQAARKQQILDSTTARTFNGGLDVADSELNLTSKYARELDNMLVGIDGSNEVRQGCRLFADIADSSNFKILNYQYFSSRIIVMDTNMDIYSVDAAGSVVALWNQAIRTAAGKAAWTPSTYIVFDEIKGNLIISDGVNKPLTITSAFAVSYLADLATGSNINVPVSAITAKFMKHFVYIVGSILNVSERDAAGTWFGDAGAVYVGSFDLASYCTTGDATVIAAVAFKQYLLVYFKECIVPVQFTEVAAAGAVLAHLDITVNPEDVTANYGTVSPRSVQDIGDLAVALDIVGVSNIEISRFTRSLSPDRPSRLIDKLIQNAVGQLGTATLHDNVFSLYDRRLAMYMLFLPNDDESLHSYTRGFGYRHIDALKINAWCTYSGWNWRCGTRSSEGRIFLSRYNDSQIFVLGDATIDPVYADFVGEQETFSDGTTYSDQTGNGPVAALADSGVPIQFSWELPRSDLGHRAITKTLRYVTLDVEGDQSFEIQVFVDNFYAEANSGEGWTDDTLFTDDTGFAAGEPTRTPALTSERIGRDAMGYGLQSYGTTPYGGGINTGTELNVLMPTKFKTMKLRFEGETIGPLKFVAITLHYQTGNVSRYGAL